MKIIYAADLFAGAGGETTGLLDAAENLNFDVDLLAINHWERAIETHSYNHPFARHYCDSIQNVDPVKAVPGGRLNLLWASPECTHHSNARGGRPKNDQSRATAWLILKWLQELYIDRVIIENVPEFTNWGPLGADGRALKSGKGKIFDAYIQSLRALGYKVDWRILNAADYGDPTTRKRLFIQAVRGKKRIAWPMPTHSQVPEMFTEKAWIPARDIIDWSIPGKSIFNRKKPLADNTIKRIEAGITRYWGKYAEPFLIILRGQSSTRDINTPLPTVTGSGAHYGLIEPFLTVFRDTGLSRGIERPLPTVTASGNHYGLVEPFLIQYYGNGDARKVTNPLDTITTKDRFALIDGNLHQLDIRFRMLKPHELAAAQGFPKDYWFSGNVSEQVKQIGNAVPCNLARELCQATLSA